MFTAASCYDLSLPVDGTISFCIVLLSLISYRSYLMVSDCLNVIHNEVRIRKQTVSSFCLCALSDNELRRFFMSGGGFLQAAAVFISTFEKERF